ncbi:hypothetical protein HBH98_214880 [Parastagonospora nodorum]|nr:hypothetical protein HBH98_214880 [Parastagonospora nodorum]KAH4360955.1 hypothetical protein HBH97_200910 [Parastagonospora nodorum]KAH4377028.1 hypothetical protein HBH99_210230 [Parastagonospora nodorum]KAH5091007.1 hypothetical protein HBH72_210330 [Parastagonospora nodorum]KAH5127088.1 hypothetical protein HBH70_235370 [Parastagonospora nodorum]
MADDDKDAEFAFNLFTDIAPLLALFGDQFAKQFTSESLTWVDHLIFAMVPLGILTAIAGAIRVQGPRIAKSFIGRGRENRALAEIELMSSTSKEVCELFNGKSIIRVMGKPKIAQILVFPHEYETLKRKDEETDQKRLDTSSAAVPTGNNKASLENKSGETETLWKDNSCGIHTFKTASSQEGSKSELLEIEEYHSWSYQVIRKILGRLTGTQNPLRRHQVDRNSVIKSLGPPNLQLGLSSDQFENSFPRTGHEAFIAAVTAVTLQASLIAIATTTIYHEPTRRAINFQPKAYGYSCYIIGSIMLSVGVGICSLAVERNTIEYNWKVLSRNKSGGESAQERITISENEADMGDSPRLLWLQQSQEVNDQSFSGYAILAGPKHHITTSSRIEDMGSRAEAKSNSTGSALRLQDGSDNNSNGRDHMTGQVSSNCPLGWALMSILILTVFRSRSSSLAQILESGSLLL